VGRGRGGGRGSRSGVGSRELSSFSSRFYIFSVEVVAGGVVFFLFLFGVVVVALSLALEVCGRCLDPNTNPMAV
jgi:hypothetical protein